MYIYKYIHTHTHTQIPHFVFIFLPDVNTNHLKLRILPSQYIYVFKNTLTINSGHFNKRRQTDGLTIHMEFLVAKL